MFGGGVCWVMFNIDRSFPACAKDINFNATKSPGLDKKPLAVGSDKSQILKMKKIKISQLNWFISYLPILK